jgi:hypothetical protein
MAIRNTILEGVDWYPGQFVLYGDVNDTFDKLYNYARGL